MTGKSGWSYAEGTFEQAWEDLSGGTQDLEKAKALVEEAGAPTEPFVFAYDSEESAEAVKVAASVKPELTGLVTTA